MSPSLAMLFSCLRSKSMWFCGHSYGTVENPFLKDFRAIHGFVNFEIGDQEAIRSIAHDYPVTSVKFLVNKM